MRSAGANRQPIFDVDLTHYPAMRVFLLTKKARPLMPVATPFNARTNSLYFTDYGDKRDLPAENREGSGGRAHPRNPSIGVDDRSHRPGDSFF